MVWFAIALVAFILELFSGTFYLLVLSLSFALTGAVQWFFQTTESANFIIAAILSLIGVAFVWKIQHRVKIDNQETREGVDNLNLGQIVVVERYLPTGRLLVQFRGTQWHAVLANHVLPEHLPCGSRARIVAQSANTLIIEPVSD